MYFSESKPHTQTHTRTHASTHARTHTSTSDRTINRCDKDSCLVKKRGRFTLLRRIHFRNTHADTPHPSCSSPHHMQHLDFGLRTSLPCSLTICLTCRGEVDKPQKVHQFEGAANHQENAYCLQPLHLPFLSEKQMHPFPPSPLSPTLRCCLEKSLPCREEKHVPPPVRLQPGMDCLRRLSLPLCAGMWPSCPCADLRPLSH